LLPGQLLFAPQELVELQLVEILELLAEAAAVVNPLTDGLFQGPGDVEQGAAALVAGGQIQGTMQLAALAAAGRFAAGASALDQGAAQEGLLSDQLGESGTGVALRGGALRALAHGVSSAVLTWYYTLRTSSADKPVDECESAPQVPTSLKRQRFGTYRRINGELAELLGAEAQRRGQDRLCVVEDAVIKRARKTAPSHAGGFEADPS
jgi:hypothetical protein